MDRKRFSKRLLLPLLGLVSVGLLWVASPGRPTPSPSANPVRVAADVTAPQSPARTAALPETPATEARNWLPPIHPRAQAVLTTALPAGPAPTQVSWTEPGGPTLVVPQSGAPVARPRAVEQPGRIAEPAERDVAAARPLLGPQAALPIASNSPVAQPTPVRPVESPRILQEAFAPDKARPAAPTRSRQLEAIAQDADRHSRVAYDLAGRGAYYAARAEFTEAMRMVAQGLDDEQQTTRHTRALTAGLTAVGEVQDFLPARHRLGPARDVTQIVAAHITPVLKGSTEGVSAAEATKCYFTFAQEQLALAMDREIAGSMALHGLGKVHLALAGQNRSHMPAPESKAMTFYQAALLVDPANYLASNDLGVLLARSGYYPEARMALEHSVAIRPQAAGWQNLAQVYRRLGDVNRASRAETLAQSAGRAESATRKHTTAGQVEWVDPQAFAQTFAQTPSARDPLPVRQPSQAAPNPAAGKPVAQKPTSTFFEKR